MIPIDKQGHFFAGGMLAAMAIPFGLTAAIFVPLVAGMGKEIADPYLKGQRDWMDFVYTAAGMVVYISWVYLVGWMFEVYRMAGL